MGKDWTGDEPVYHPEFGKRKRKTKLRKLIDKIRKRKNKKNA